MTRKGRSSGARRRYPQHKAGGVGQERAIRPTTTTTTRWLDSASGSSSCMMMSINHRQTSSNIRANHHSHGIVKSNQRLLVALTRLVLLWTTTTCCMQVVNAQTVSDCSCAPTAYTFRLNLDQHGGCPSSAENNGILSRKGIQDLSCTTVNYGNGTDMVPLQVTTVQFLDLGLDLQVAQQQQVDGFFQDGDTVTFTSMTSVGENVTGGLTVVMNAINSRNETVVNSFMATFTNDCDAYPVFDDGDEIGWVILTDLAPPREETCPVAPPLQTAAPSVSPSTSSPSYAPFMSFSMSMNHPHHHRRTMMDWDEDMLLQFALFGRQAQTEHDEQVMTGEASPLWASNLLEEKNAGRTKTYDSTVGPTIRAGNVDGSTLLRRRRQRRQLEIV